MFGKIAAFELRYQLRQPVFWVATAIFFLFTYGAITSDILRIEDTANIHKNSPANIIVLNEIFAFLYMFVTTAFVANVVIRDNETGFGPILYSTRVSRFDYLYGRFLGAFGAAALSFLAVPLGIFLGTLMPWIDPETLGPNRLADYAWPFLVIGVPDVLLTSAVFFAVACVVRSMMGAYFGVIGFLVARTVATVLLARNPDLRHVLALAEPFGFAAVGEATRYWTAAESNSSLPALVGDLLWNRLIWIGASVGVLALTWLLFRTSSRGARLDRTRKLAQLADAAAPAPTSAAPLPRPVFDGRTARAQFWARTRMDMAQVFRSPGFLVLMALGLALSILILTLNGKLYGVRPYPVTPTVIQYLRGGFSLFPFIVAIFYAGELVWRDRDRRTHEIIDATAAPDWSFLIPKTLALALVLVSTFVIGALTGVVFQTFNGFTRYELDHYLLWYVLPGAANALILAALAIFVQSLVPHKFIGWGVMVLYIIAFVVADRAGVEDRLLLYGQTPDVPLSDMNGIGRFWEPRTWFQAYWGALALALLILADRLWRRGAETRLTPRLQRLRARLKGLPGVALASSLTAFVGLGAWIFVNTHVWNTYRTSQDEEKRQAAFEKMVRPYLDIAAPTITSVKFDVDLRPHAREATTRGVYTLENQTAAPISEIHVLTDFNTELRQTTIPGARLEKSWPEFHYAIYRLAQPLAPGARTTLSFTTSRGQKGFRNDGYGTRIVDNGTFLNNFEIAPQLRADDSQFLNDRIKRRKYKLEPEEIHPPKLNADPAARGRNYLDGASWLTSDITVSTDADQTPIAPGYKVSDVVRGGRRTARFRSDTPILDFFSIQSARYAEKHALYRGVDIGVYYDPKHAWNVQRMIDAAKAGLDYYQPNFSPYQFRQLRFIEFPDYAGFAQSFANTVPWSEAIGFTADLRDPAKIDYVTYVGDHELGHQWWAHQVIGAKMQGETTLSETLAQYSSLMVMEKLYGPDKIRRFLKYELDTYLRSRGTEAHEEQPLYTNENQPYIHYNKGSLVMYLLKDQIGADNVNAALRDVLRQYAFKGAPYPTSLDLMTALRAHAPADQQGLITDLFQKITLWDVKAKAVEAKKRPDGKWAVRLTVEARKLYADGKGKETEAPMANESYDFGLFAAKPGEGAFGAKDVILFERRPLSSGTQVYDFVVAKKPAWAGVDPYNKRIDRNSDDNLIRVSK